MRILSGGILAAAALVTMVGVAQATTAGHMLKPAMPAANADQDVSGSIKKPGATDPDTTGSIKKHRTKKTDVTGSTKPKPNSDH
jgi:hypothetical protein